MLELNRIEIASIFRDVSYFSMIHFNDVMSVAKAHNIILSDMDLEKGAPVHSTDPTNDSNFDSLQTPYDALLYAIDKEHESHDFYLSIAQMAATPLIQKIAYDFANEEERHIATLESWITLLPRMSA